MPDADKVSCRELTSICIVDTSGRKSNLASVMARGLPLSRQGAQREGPLAIVASGPSVADYLDELRVWPGEVWAINGAYDWLLDQGVIPRGFFALDPLPELADYLRRPHASTTFYLASTCDPAVFDALEGHKVELFHGVAEDIEYPEGLVVGGGTTAATRVPYLGLWKGWRDITMFGCDSSFTERVYCYDWGRYATDIDNKRVWVEANGEGPFQTELGLMKQVSQLAVLHSKFNGRLKIRCGGLMDAFMRAPIVDDSRIEVENPEGWDVSSS